jgi:inosine/xanthosine triphosphate pyrophosphatase family protein
MELRIAVRREGSQEIEVIAATCPGRIADKPAGPHALGWDRLFVPEGEDYTLAQLIDAGEVTEFRRLAYTNVARVLGLAQ